MSQEKTSRSVAELEAPQRRTGDTIEIAGSYQYDAATKGNAVQRFWHLNKLLTIERLLPPGPGERVIDVGCGSGVISNYLAESGADVLGIDGNHAAIEFAREQFQAPNLRFVEGLVDEEFTPEAPLDKIYCLELIEHIHLPQARRMLELFGRILAPGGKVFLTTPNYRSAWPLIEWAMDRFTSAPEMADHQHVTKYHRGKFLGLCRETGFGVEHYATTCFAAPWIAPLGQGLARRINSIETDWGWLPGSISVAVLGAGG